MSAPTLWDGNPLLPPIGALVLISHARDELDHVCEVMSYEVKPGMVDRDSHHRVFVNVVYRGTDTKNQRLLNDIRPLTRARSIAGGDAWQPIESAPKDGTVILMFARAKHATASVVVVGYWLDQEGYPGMWVDCAFSPNRPIEVVPSHWMPRPGFPDTDRRSRNV